MSRYVDRIRLPKELDRRRKLTDEQKEEIKELHKRGLTCKHIAVEFGVSGTLIQRVVNPEYAAAQDEAIKQRHDERRYYDREKQVAYNAINRERKRELFKQGIITLPQATRPAPQPPETKE